MSNRSLSLIALAILGTSPWFSAHVSDPTSPGPWCANTEVETAADPESAKTCAMCHRAIFKEWDGAKHSRAWTDEIYQAAIKKKRRAKSCYACHIPDRVLARLGKKPRTRPKAKAALYHEGVTCVACHELDGEIHGPFGAKTDAHKSVKDPLFTDANSSKLCVSCHSTKIDVVLPVGRDFTKANLAAKGKSCAGCHMPKVTRHIAVSPTSGEPVGQERKGRRHRLLGPTDPEFCAKAFKLSAAKKDGQVIVTITNGAGHRVPGLRTRAFHVLVRQLDKAGKAVSDKTITIDSENGLLVEEAREFPFEFVQGAENVEVVIEHHFMKKLVAKIKTRRLKL